VAQLGDMRFDCPVCGKPVTVPVREIDGGQYAVEVTADLSVIRRHMASVHPELARRGPVPEQHTLIVTVEASGEVTPANPQPDAVEPTVEEELTDG
jgi:hypothetical protein